MTYLFANIFPFPIKGATSSLKSWEGKLEEEYGLGSQ